MGLQGSIGEKVGFRISKATAKGLARYQRANGFESRADALRAALREAGL